MTHQADIDWAVVERIAVRDTDPAHLAMMRARVAALLQLGPSQATPTDPQDRALADFVDQFVLDVSSVSDAQRGAAFGVLGDGIAGFAQALYAVDLGIRRVEVLRRLGPSVPAPEFVVDILDDLAMWPALERYLRTVAKMRALDPATTELVRVRGAAAHQCRICKSRLSISAIEQLGSSDAIEAIIASRDTELAPAHAVALQLVDAIVTQPTSLDDATVAALHAHYTPEQLHEMVHDVVRNALNKFAVALGGDAPVVSDGFEFYDIDETGDVVADVDAAKVKAAVGA